MIKSLYLHGIVLFIKVMNIALYFIFSVLTSRPISLLAWEIYIWRKANHIHKKQTNLLAREDVT
jgi:hypothetical protein